jgi:hypothetical protein
MQKASARPNAVVAMALVEIGEKKDLDRSAEPNLRLARQLRAAVRRRDVKALRAHGFGVPPAAAAQLQNRSSGR